MRRIVNVSKRAMSEAHLLRAQKTVCLFGICVMLVSLAMPPSVLVADELLSDGEQTTVQEIPEEQTEEDELEFEGVDDESDSPIEEEGETTSPDESETPSDDSAETEPAESVPSSDEAEQTADEEDSGAEVDACRARRRPSMSDYSYRERLSVLGDIECSEADGCKACDSVG